MFWKHKILSIGQVKNWGYVQPSESSLDPHYSVSSLNPGISSADLCMFTGWKNNINPLGAKFFRENINIYLHFVSYLHIDMTRVAEILPQIGQGLAHST